MLRRAGLIGDIHCEVVRLKRVLEHFRAAGVDTVLSVGDLADGPGDLAEACALLREANALPFLTRHDSLDWHLHATSPEAPLAERIRAEAALALIDVIRTNETHRLRVCEADDCTGLLVDLSRNGLKRFCSVRCGNRMNMIAFRERRSTATEQ